MKKNNSSEEIFSFAKTVNKENIKKGSDFVSIEAGTFSETEIDHIDWPEGVQSIGHDAFAHCGNLETVVIPNTVVEVGERAFIECLLLRSITFSRNMVEIPSGCCAECLALKSVAIPANIRTIGYSAFVKCLSLKNVTLRRVLLPSRMTPSRSATAWKPSACLLVFQKSGKTFSICAKI